MLRRFLRNFLLLVAATAAVAVAAEILLRTTHLFGARRAYTQPDSLIGWRFTPGAAYWQRKENARPISGHINAHGWRDRERSLEKPADTYRVAVIGDSYVEAMQVELDSTFTAMVERRSGGAVELLNLGRSGMTQTEEWLVLQGDVPAFEPDAVAVFFYPLNDIDDAEPARADTRMRPFYTIGRDGTLELDTRFNRTRAYRLRSVINPLKQRSALVSLVAERYNIATRARKRASANTADRIPAALTLCTATPDTRALASYELCKRLLAECATFCRDRGVRFVLVGIAVAYDRDTASRLNGLDPTFDADFFDRDLRSWADSMGVDYVGLQEAFRAQSRGGAHALQWGHWNYAGHRVVAHEFGRWLDGVREHR